MVYDDTLYHTHFAHLSEAIFLTDDHGTIISASPNAPAILGYQPEEINERSSIQDLVGGILVDNSLLDQKKEINGITVSRRGVNGCKSFFSARISRLHRLQGKRLYVFQPRPIDATNGNKSHAHRLQMEAISKIAKLANSSLNLNQVLERILNGTLEAVNASVGMIFLKNSETGQFCWAASTGLPDRFIAEFREHSISPGEGLTGIIALNGKPIYIPEDSSHDPRIARPVVIEENLHSYIGVPIHVAENIIGVMNILTRPPMTLSEDDVTLISAVGTQVGSAIRNAQLYEDRRIAKIELQLANRKLEERIRDRTADLGRVNSELIKEILTRKETEEDLRKRERELSIRNRIANVFLTVSGKAMYGEVLQVVIESLQCRLGIFSYLGENGEMICPTMTRTDAGNCAMSENLLVLPRKQWQGAWNKLLLTNETMSAKHPFATPDGEISIHNWLGVPILHKKSLIGTLQVANKDSGFTDDDLQLLEAIARHVAPVLNEIMRRNLEEKSRKQVQRELAKRNREFLRAKEEAEAASRAKSEFLANMSHEIRTPLNGIIGFTDVVRQQISSPKERDFLTMIKDSADRLLNIVNDILDFSKIEAGKLELEKTSFSLRGTVGSALSLLLIKAEEKSLALEWLIDEDVPDTLVGDPGRLVQVIINLINNALKFTERGSVNLHIGRLVDQIDGVRLRFAVRDTGIGIDPDKRETIFKPFCQADGSFTRRFGGTGLGLTICSQLVGLMDGEIWLESTTANAGPVTDEGIQPTGTTFYFTARFASGIPVCSEVQRLDKPLPGATKIDLADLHILLVEDEFINRTLACEIIKQQNWRVTTAEDGQAALALFPTDDFNLILMDIQMPEMDGYQTTAAIRAKEQEHGGRIPIVALTAHALKGDRERCLDAGMDDYLSKPIRPAELVEVVAKQLAGG
ncbi:MAG: GAF domain-containing protein [Desulfobulbaceae bacterium]|nr:GAF domain-containing protein [Desulfobulbaceae bacterium]